MSETLSLLLGHTRGLRLLLFLNLISTLGHIAPCSLSLSLSCTSRSPHRRTVAGEEERLLNKEILFYNFVVPFFCSSVFFCFLLFCNQAIGRRQTGRRRVCMASECVVVTGQGGCAQYECPLLFAAAAAAVLPCVKLNIQIFHFDVCARLRSEDSSNAFCLLLLASLERVSIEQFGIAFGCELFFLNIYLSVLSKKKQQRQPLAHREASSAPQAGQKLARSGESLPVRDL